MGKNFLLILFLLTIIPLFSKEPEELYSDMYNLFVDSSGDNINDYSGLNSFLTLYVPPGGKYEGMGTAFTGVPNDIGFFNANPSVSSRLNLSEVSFFINNFIEDVSMQTIAFTGRKNDLGYGFQGKWLHVGFTGVNDWAERDGKGLYSEFILKNNISYNFLNGFDFSGLSVGASFNLGYRDMPESIYYNLDVQKQSSLALFFDLGILTEFNFLKFYASRARNFSIGLSLMNIGRELINAPDPLPSSGNAGISYSPIEPLTITYDLSYKFNLHESNNFDSFQWKLSPGEGFYHAFGFDLQVLDFASIHGGFLYKIGNPRLTLGTEINYRKNPGEYVSMEREIKESKNQYVFVINYSLDLHPALNRISIEMKLNLGDYNRLERRETIQNLYVNGLKEFSEGNILEAIKIWESCIKMDKNFDPAIRMLELANQSIELQKKIKDSQTVK